MEIELLAAYSLMQLKKFTTGKHIKKIINNTDYTDIEALNNFIDTTLYFLHTDNLRQEYININRKSKNTIEVLDLRNKIHNELKYKSIIDFTLYLTVSYKSLLILSVKKSKVKFRKSYLKILKNILELIVIDIKKQDLKIKLSLSTINEDIDTYINMMLN